MRFQPSWIVESLQPAPIESVFFPMCPNPEGVLWFKRHGARLYVNDPRPTRFLPLHALVENDGETFADENLRKFNKVMNKSPDFSLNPFRNWENRPFDRRQLDYLFYWREAAEEISYLVQRNLFYTAIRSVLAHWVGLAAAKVPVYYAPDEVLGHFLKRQSEWLFRGKEPVYTINEPLVDLSEEVQAGLYVVPLIVSDGEPSSPDFELFFYAWLKGSGDVTRMAEDLEKKVEGWVFEWGRPGPFDRFAKKAGTASRIAVCWSADGWPPKVHEEQIAQPLISTFSPRFPKYRLHMKTADQVNEDYDFLMIFSRE